MSLTIELHEIMEHPLLDVFDFDYPFYTDQAEAKQQFEELFIAHFYFHEIGCETVARWQQQLKSRLLLKMPYYAQLYQTEWTQHLEKDMMTSKNLTETTTRELTSSATSNGENSQSSTGEFTGNQSNTQSITQSDEHTQSSEATSTQMDKRSSLQNGVGLVGVDDASSLTEMGEATNETEGTQTDTSESVQSQTASSEQSSNMSNTQTGTHSNEETNNQTETITFTSIGDVGVQTPAYAIREWRTIIINLNEQLIHEFDDLFLQIY